MDFDERYFINADGRLRTPIKLFNQLSGHSHKKSSSMKTPPAVPPKRVVTGKLKRLKGDYDDVPQISKPKMQH